MKKFVINDAIITKSSKDIATNVKQEFTDKINIIYGNNEAGKSSLMNFLKTAFFKGSECGIINFSLSDGYQTKSYRADIKDSGRIEKRLTLHDENGNICDNSVITESVNKKYFEQGFTVTLDDLMNIQNKDTATLTDVIKDPTGQILYNFEEGIKSKAKKLFGDNNRPTKELNNIKDEITTLSNEIDRQRGNEELYNYAVNTIKDADKKLSQMADKIKYCEIYDEIKRYEADYNNLYEHITAAENSFNQNFYEKRYDFIELMKNTGIFEINSVHSAQLKNKVSELNEKISEMFDSLKNEYSFTPDKETINNFDVSNMSKNKIKELINKKQELRKSILVSQTQRNIAKETFIRIDNAVKNAESNSITEEEYEKLKTLYSELKTGAENYSSLLSKLKEIDDNDYGPPKFIIPGIIIFGLVIITAVIILALSLQVKNYQALSAGISGATIGISGLFLLIKKLKSSNSSSERKRITAQIESEGNNLRTKISENYKETEEDEPKNLAVKFNEIINEIRLKLENYDRLKAFIDNNKKEADILNEKIVQNEDIIGKTEYQIMETDAEINEIIKKSGYDESVSGEEYLEMTIILSELQKNLKELESTQNELNEKTNANNHIISLFNNFVNETGIKFKEDAFLENMMFLRAYDDTNNKRKAYIDELKIRADIIKQKINETENKMKEFKDNEDFKFEIEDRDKIRDEKEILTATIKDAEYTKKSLEEGEGLNELKLSRELALKEYRRKTAELLKYKLILSLTEKAKNDFDKIQPCLSEAEKYLAIITGRKYSKINLNAEEISNEDYTVTKKWNELSRGTKEQLYFALRLGYAANYSRDTMTGNEKVKPALPLIIDDAFVNFDEERLLNVFKCLNEFTENNQIFFFTCRKNDVNAALKICGVNVNIIKV